MSERDIEDAGVRGLRGGGSEGVDGFGWSDEIGW